MRHLPQNFCPGDRLELTLTVDAELVESESSELGRLMSVRVGAIKNYTNGQPVLWRQRDDGELLLAVTVGEKQRLMALGLSARQRESLKERLGGLSAEQASALLAELHLREDPKAHRE